jgi:hypothetical protein
MGERVQIPFGTKTAEPRSPASTSERLINWYVEKAPEKARYPLVLHPTPGLLLFATVGTGPIRGMLSFAGALWVVSGPSLYVIDNNGVAIEVGAIGGSGHVYMIENGIHLGIATDGPSYAANLDGIIPLPEGSFVGAAYQDGYGIFAKGGTETFWITGIDDMTTIGALDFSSTDAFADYLMGCVSDHRELWLFGRDTVEVWNNTGDAAFPFARTQGGFIERGCAASASIAKANNMVLWLGNDRNVYAAQGYQPQSMSPPEIANIIEQQSDVSSCRATVYSQGGHTFYPISFGGRTLALDLTTGAWHERSSGGSRWRAGTTAYQWEKTFAGDYENGNVYELSLSTHTDNGDPIIRQSVSAPIHVGGLRASMASLEIEMEVGVGLVSGQGSDPEIMVDWSDDDGHTWSNQRVAKIGKAGERKTTVRINRLGSFRRRAIRITSSDPVPLHIVDAWADIEART